MDNLIYTTATGDEDLKGIIAVRREVFTKEMGIPEEQVFDGHDERMLQIAQKMHELFEDSYNPEEGSISQDALEAFKNMSLDLVVNVYCL